MVLAQHNICQENEKLAMVVFVGGSRLHEAWPSQPTTGEFSGTKGPDANAVSSGHCLIIMTVEDIASRTQDYLTAPSASVVWFLLRRNVCCDVSRFLPCADRRL